MMSEVFTVSLNTCCDTKQQGRRQRQRWHEVDTTHDGLTLTVRTLSWTETLVTASCVPTVNVYM